MGQLKLSSTSLPGVCVVESQPFVDHRGAFTRLFCAREMAGALGGRSIVQANHSRTAMRGAVRGLHYQLAPHAEMKFVRCLKGRIWDVAVDLRAGSHTFRSWYAEELNPTNQRGLVIPEGCAHGFQALEPDTEVIYFATAYYAPEFEKGVLHDDPLLSITWPLPVSDLSVRDRGHPRLGADFRGIVV